MAGEKRKETRSFERLMDCWKRELSLVGICRVFAASSDPRPIDVESIRDRNQAYSKEAEHARRPWYAEAMIHQVDEQRVGCGKDTP